MRSDTRQDEWDPESRNRTLWHSQSDLETCAVEYEFYLGDEPDGSPRRSPIVRLGLPNRSGRSVETRYQPTP